MTKHPLKKGILFYVIQNALLDILVPVASFNVRVTRTAAIRLLAHVKAVAAVMTTGVLAACLVRLLRRLSTFLYLFGA